MTPLRQALSDYLVLRRALGYRLERTEKLLGQFLDYLDAQGAASITVEDALDWARLPEGADPSWWSQRLSVVRKFARHLAAEDPTVEVPPQGLLPTRSPRAHPYLYSEEEIDSLLVATRILRGELRRATYATLIGLLAVTGMRVGEAIALDCSDFDPDEGVVLVRRAKGGKTRELPLHPSSSDALAHYLARRTAHPKASVSEALFISPPGTRLLYCGVHWTWLRLVAEAGIHPRSAACRPRIHDLRHGFAVRAQMSWVEEGKDLEAWLPYLAAYMGHEKYSSTAWYVHLLPERLAATGLTSAAGIIPAVTS